MPELRKKPLQAEILAAPAPRPETEVRVGASAVAITMNLPEVRPADAEVILTRSSLRIVSKTNPDTHHWIVPLPVAVNPARFVLRFNHGVLDLVAERGAGSR